MDRGNKRDGERLSQRERVRKKKMYRQIVKQLAFQLLTAFHVNVLDWHFLHIPAPTSLPPHTHTHSLSFHLFYSSILSVSRRIKESGRRGKGQEERASREWRRREGKKNRETGEIRLSPGLAKGQSWQARRLNCRVKILFIILCSLFPNSPLLCHSQCPASMFPTPGFIRHCWAARKGTFSVQ